MRSDLKLEVSLRKLACVLDPALLLCHASGPKLALRLAQTFEPWLTRSFWQALDASELLLAAVRREPPRGGGTPVSAAALAEWLALRECTEPAAWLLRWLGDRFAESRLGEEADVRLLERWEQLAEALLNRGAAAPDATPRRGHGFDAGAAALDALALSATLDGAVVLCEADPGARHEPYAVAAAQRAGLAPRLVEPMPADSYFVAERTLLRESLARAGLAALLEDRLHAAALHALPADDAGGEDPWAGARVWWYRL